MVVEADLVVVEVSLEGVDDGEAVSSPFQVMKSLMTRCLSWCSAIAAMTND